MKVYSIGVDDEHCIASVGLTAALFPSSLLDIYIFESKLKLQHVVRGQCGYQLTEAF